MTATCLHLTADRATVLLRPCRLARWLGARDLVADLELDNTQTWTHAATGNRVTHERYGTEIIHALQFRPAERVLPAAQAMEVCR